MVSIAEFARTHTYTRTHTRASPHTKHISTEKWKIVQGTDRQTVRQTDIEKTSLSSLDLQTGLVAHSNTLW